MSFPTLRVECNTETESLDVCCNSTALDFPAGILFDGHYENHLNWDAVKIFRSAWPNLDDATRERARGEISRMLKWCLTKSYQPDPAKRQTSKSLSRRAADAEEQLRDCSSRRQRCTSQRWRSVAGPDYGFTTIRATSRTLKNYSYLSAIIGSTRIARRAGT